MNTHRGKDMKKLTQRIMQSLVFAAILVVPALSTWIFGREFDLLLDPLHVGLAVFALFVVVIGHILHGAAVIKADSDAIV